MKESIFVSIASYRDKELIKTVNSCLAKAKHPERISIGICWQYDEEEDITVFDKNNQIKSYKVYWKNVEGSVCWARSIIQKELFTNQDYYFQIDSHTLFTQDWDEILISMYKELPTKKAVISVGPPYYYDMSAEGALPPEDWDTNIEEVEGIKYETVVKKQKLDSLTNGFFMYGFLPAEDISKPIPARHISAALLFTTGEWVKDVPYDADLYFHGEEGSLALRSYTHGYDLYNPNKFIVWHLKYLFPVRKRHWNTFDEATILKLQAKSNEKYQKIIRGEVTDIYGIGTERTLEDWERYSGVSYRFNTATDAAYKGEVPTIQNKMRVLVWGIEKTLNTVEEKAKLLKQTAEKYKAPVEFIGVGESFTTFTNRLYILEEYLKKCDSKEVVMVMDGYDTLVNRDITFAEQIFLEKKTKLLISAEKIFTYQWATFKDKFETIGTDYKYVNAGTFIGYVEDILDMLSDLFDLYKKYPTNIDQGLLGVWVYNNFEKKETVQLDTQCEIFWVTSGDWHTLEEVAKEDHIKNPNTGTIPVIIHNTGNGDKNLFKAYKAAYTNIINRI